LQQEEQQPAILQNIIFTDECLFTCEGLFNNHNYHIWSQDNPHKFMVNNFQHRFKINLWAGLLDDTLVRYFIFLFIFKHSFKENENNKFRISFYFFFQI